MWHFPLDGDNEVDWGCAVLTNASGMYLERCHTSSWVPCLSEEWCLRPSPHCTRPGHAEFCTLMLNGQAWWLSSCRDWKQEMCCVSSSSDPAALSSSAAQWEHLVTLERRNQSGSTNPSLGLHSARKARVEGTRGIYKQPLNVQVGRKGSWLWERCCWQKVRWQQSEEFSLEPALPGEGSARTGRAFIDCPQLWTGRGAGLPPAWAETTLFF